MTAGGSFLRDLMVLLFAVTCGLTLSGITANIYRILARKPASRGETLLYYGVMVLAGRVGSGDFDRAGSEGLGRRMGCRQSRPRLRAARAGNCIRRA